MAFKDEGNATALNPYNDDRIIVNLRYGKPQDLRDFVFKSAHVTVIKATVKNGLKIWQTLVCFMEMFRQDIFLQYREAVERLDYLQQNGKLSICF